MTKIEWTDATWNPVVGCSLVSAGCTNCYAMHMARRLEAMGCAKYQGLTRRSGTGGSRKRNRTVWTGRVREDWQALQAPYTWKKPRKVFVNSMSDLFHEGVSEEFIRAVWDVMRETPRHTYQILTKRPERMAEIVPRLPRLPNAWLGTTVENAAAVPRMEVLRRVPAAVRFISFEPLIGPVGPIGLSGIHWAIVGGESGPGARSMHPDWVREIRDQCVAAGVPFFFKQRLDALGRKISVPDLDGRTWDEMPEVRAWHEHRRKDCNG